MKSPAPFGGHNWFTVRLIAYFVRSPEWRAVLVVLLLSLLPYMGMFACKSFVMDDAVAVQRNPNVISASVSLGEFLGRDFWGLPLFAGSWTHKSFRPVTTWTYRVNFLIHGLGSCGFHVANWVLHACVCVGVYFCAKKVFAFTAYAALAPMALFACHPIHTENLMYLVGRADICATIFFIAALVAVPKSAPHIAFIFVLNLLAGLSKETGFTAPLIAAGIEFLKTGKALTQKIFLYLAIGISLMAWRHWYTTGTEVNMSVQDNPISYETVFAHRFFSYLYVHGKYFQLLLFPLELCYDYSLAAIPIVREFADVRNLLGLTAYVSVFGLAHYAIFEYSRKSKSPLGYHLLVGLALVLVPWLPASNILFPVGTVIGERLLYTPSLGFVLIVSAFCMQLSGPRGLQLVLVLCAVYSLRTVVRVSDWADGDTLFVRDGHRQTASSKTQFNLGITHMSNKQYDRAVPALIRCAAADPMSALPYWRIGQIEILKGNFKTAEAWLMEASTKFSATLMIKDEEIFHDIAVAVFQNKKVDRAHFYLSLALEINPNFPKGLNNYGCLLASTRPAEAVRFLRQAVDLNPKSFIYLSNLIFMARYAGQEAEHAVSLMRTHYPQQLVSQLKNDCVWEFVPAS